MLVHVCPNTGTFGPDFLVAELFEFVGKLLRPDPALAFPSIVRAAPLDLALGAMWLALVLGTLLIGSLRPEQTVLPHRAKRH